MPPTLHPLLAGRYSCRHYDGQPVPDQDLLTLLEAARWAPSSYNDQPWSFLVASRSDQASFAKMLACTGGNQDWCRDAGALVLCVGTTLLSHNGKPNRQYAHDIGLAVMAMAVQGVALGLQMREMGGIDREKAARDFQVPPSHDVWTGLAIGYPKDGPGLQEKLAGRQRKPLKDFVFGGQWGQVHPLVQG